MRKADFRYDRSATDLIGLNGSNGVTLDQDAAVVFGSIHHRITPKLFGSLHGPVPELHLQRRHFR